MKFIQIPIDILGREDLTPADKLVFGMIADHMGQNSVAWPGLRLIAKNCGLDLSTAMRATKRLEVAGLLNVERVEGNPSGRTNRYRLSPASSKGERSQKDDVGILTGERSQKDDCDVGILTTQPYPLNQTQGTIPTLPVKKVRSKSTWGPVVSELTAYFVAAWQKRNPRSRYPHHGSADTEAIKALYRAVDSDLARAQAIMERFLDDPDKWLSDKGHDLKMLRSRLVRYLEKPTTNPKGSNGNGHRSISTNDPYKNLLAAPRR